MKTENVQKEENAWNQEIFTQRSGIFGGKLISWGAVFAGAIIALGIQLLLSLLGLGIGMGAINPLKD